MTSGPPDAIATGAASQLAALLATVAGAGLVAALVRGGLWLRHRRRGTEVDDRGQARIHELPDRAAMARRLLGALLLLALVLPTAAAVRQLWPHPDLGSRLALVWSLVLLLPAVTWLLTRGGGRPGRPRS